MGPELVSQNTENKCQEITEYESLDCKVHSVLLKDYCNPLAKV